MMNCTASVQSYKVGALQSGTRARWIMARVFSVYLGETKSRQMDAGLLPIESKYHTAAPRVKLDITAGFSCAAACRSLQRTACVRGFAKLRLDKFAYHLFHRVNGARSHCNGTFVSHT